MSQCIHETINPMIFHIIQNHDEQENLGSRKKVTSHLLNPVKQVGREENSSENIQITSPMIPQSQRASHAAIRRIDVTQARMSSRER